MKRSCHRVLLFAISMPLILGAVFMQAQNAGNAAQTAPAAQTPPGAPTGAPVLIARMVSDFSTKKANVGDPIKAKTEKALKLPDVEIPKGSMLVGSVTSVQSVDAGKGTAALGIKFDHVEMKDNKVMPINGLIFAIGQVGGQPTGLGYDGILGRGGVGSTPGADPSLGAGHGPTDAIPNGSSLEGVALGIHLDPSGATQLRGFHRDIKFDNHTMIKVALFRPAS